MSASTEAGTILLVDDAPSMRSLLQQSLEQRGYRVLEAEDPVGALAINNDYSGPIHFLLTDLLLPQMSGQTLALLIQRLRPEIKTIFMSGYARDAFPAIAPEAIFLEKPFHPDALDSLLRKLREEP
jgi:two-component system, cell cycle sensor histidine kinase and response regulator CckA